MSIKGTIYVLIVSALLPKLSKGFMRSKVV